MADPKPIPDRAQEDGGCPCCTAWRAPELVRKRGPVPAKPGQPQQPIAEFGNFFVLQNAQVHTLQNDVEDGAPALLDIWVGGGKIVGLTPPSSSSVCPTIPGLKVVDVSGMIVVPGFVDVHVHATGGGGEAGFGSRTPEASQSDLIEAGVTTFVATLGTDTVTRSMENLIAKTRALSSGGLTGRAWLGGYSFPIENTVTGSVRRDVTLLPEVIGVGELAISDFRGSYMSTEELTRLASEVRVAGMLSDKAGVTYCHLGEDGSGLQPLKEAVKQNPTLIAHLVPTHMERTPELIEEGVQWMRSGGRIDFSGWPEKQREAIRQYIIDRKMRAMIYDRLSISSDSYGSINEFDDEGRLIKYSYGKPNTLLRTLLALVYEDEVPINTALRFFCSNPGSLIQMDGKPLHKGKIIIGGDADLLVLKLPPLPIPDSYPREERFGMKWPSTEGVLQYVIARGCVLKSLI